jgi:predicted Rdx family selenoprotein
VLCRSDGQAVAVNLDMAPVEKPEQVLWIDPSHPTGGVWPIRCLASAWKAGSVVASKWVLAASAVGAQTGDHHFGGAVDVDRLAMAAARGKGAEGVVCDPPHVAAGPARQTEAVATLSKRLAAALELDVVDPRNGHHLLTIELATQAHHFAKAGHVAQDRVGATARKLGAVAVDQQIGGLFGAQLGPDALAQQPAHRLAAGAPHQAAQHVGIDGLVIKALPMFAQLCSVRRKP